jgi:hypothetical protein
MKKLALLALVALAGFNANADTINGLHNTGSLSSTVPGADANYTVDGHYAYITDNNSFPLNHWFQNTGTSSWLTPSADQGESYDPSSAGTYTWTMNFQIGAGYAANTASFSGHFGADNSAIAYLNGVQIGSTNGFDALSFSSFSAASGLFAQGNNVFTVVVTNDAYGAGNPTGLRVEFDQSNITAVPEPETYAMMLAGLGLLGVAARRRKAK